jgi:hypothetical protein
VDATILYSRMEVKTTCIQVPFITTDEVERITNFIEKQQGYPTTYMLPELIHILHTDKTSLQNADG